MQRLLLALVEEFQLGKTVEARLRTFLSHASARHKDRCHALGAMTALLSVCDSIRWTDFIRVYLEESFDRNVLWICKEFPELAEVCRPAHKEDTPAGPIDMDRLEKSFAASHVSHRLCMFHAFFVNHVVRSAGSSHATAESLDQFYGRPHNKLRGAFCAAVKRIKAVEGWPAFFQYIGLQVPTRAHLTGWLVQSLQNSRRKGYHKHGMDFSRIHRSGVSKILLKGESYAAGHRLRHVKMEEVWGTAGANASFLDASCLAFSQSGHPLQTVDYRSRSGFGGAVKHSGDVMDAGRSEGRHTIEIDLHRLPANVHSLYFTISAWTGNLNTYTDPRVYFMDAVQDVDLCQYNLEATCKNESKTAIIMCKLVRSGSSGSAQEWAVTAIGHIGDGNARDYAPLQKTIAAAKL